LHRLMRTRASGNTSPRSKSPFTNMQHAQSTSAPRVDALPSASEQHTTQQIQIAVSALELRISEHIQASSTALLAQLQRFTCPNVPTSQQQSIPPDSTIVIEGTKAAREPPIDMLNDDSELLEPEFFDFSTYGKCRSCRHGTPPIAELRLWTMTDDTARYLNDKRSQAGYDKYLHIC
jgi:hypothetical protein